MHLGILVAENVVTFLIFLFALPGSGPVGSFFLFLDVQHFFGVENSEIKDRR